MSQISSSSSRTTSVLTPSGRSESGPGPPPSRSSGQKPGKRPAPPVPEVNTDTMSTFKSATLKSNLSHVTSLGSEVEEDLGFATFAERYFPKGKHLLIILLTLLIYLLLIVNLLFTYFVYCHWAWRLHVKSGRIFLIFMFCWYSNYYSHFFVTPKL